jgi:hypothetical protein
VRHSSPDRNIRFRRDALASLAPSIFAAGLALMLDMWVAGHREL